jgi:hypothetical protein
MRCDDCHHRKEMICQCPYFESGTCTLNGDDCEGLLPRSMNKNYILEVEI